MGCLGFNRALGRRVWWATVVVTALLGLALADEESTDNTDESRVPLHITNMCGSTVWPAILTQYGSGPGTGGFELKANTTANMTVSYDWQGRVWGRTNCTSSEGSLSCLTGDCNRALDCQNSGSLPATLAEFTLAGGVDNMQNFYDISLVDGYNLPVSIRHLPQVNSTTIIPASLSDPACIATPGYLTNATSSSGHNTTFPMPWEPAMSDETLSQWCPRANVFSPADDGGGGGFSPCLSACAATGREEDCCVGEFNHPSVCPKSDYSRRAKAACPDAYSYAYDDLRSTFVVPRGGGFEVVMCPRGRSTRIQHQLAAELWEMTGHFGLSEESLERLRNKTYVDMDKTIGQ